ncbi:hypothetical protein DYU11_26395 [Fibrisoma montanum]|uniref:Uncharacterized protein n=1 Tax=Fibrisoma montanum TaxID=2305895 RepID=A0A418M071_9BACT|nr:hypothetical protein [Fibrisoma montanum]RIV19030.1 hypothetical protein DYU11_26395 [Fibrisoma montanum]
MKSLAKSAFWLPGILAVPSASTLPRDASLPGDRPALANMYLDRPAVLFDFSLMEAVQAQKDNVPYSSKNPLYKLGFGLSYSSTAVSRR